MNRQAAASLAESAMQAVFDSVVVSRMREDSLLTVAGYTPDDAVALVEAVAASAAAAGQVCALTDTDLDGMQTVADLISAIEISAIERAAGGR